jgi:hypothetical protein
MVYSHYSPYGGNQTLPHTEPEKDCAFTHARQKEIYVTTRVFDCLPGRAEVTMVVDARPKDGKLNVCFLDSPQRNLDIYAMIGPLATEAYRHLAADPSRSLRVLGHDMKEEGILKALSSAAKKVFDVSPTFEPDKTRFFVYQNKRDSEGKDRFMEARLRQHQANFYSFDDWRFVHFNYVPKPVAEPYLDIPKVVTLQVAHQSRPQV